MMGNKLAPLIVVSALMAASQAGATCRASLQVPSEVRFVGEDDRGYNSFATANYASDFAVTIKNDDDRSRCLLLLSFQREPGLQELQDAAGNGLHYEIGQSGNRADIVDAEGLGSTPPSALRIELAPGALVQRRFSFFIPPGQIEPSGAYADTILVRALDPDTLDLTAERSIRLQTRIRQQVSIFVADDDLTQASADRAGAHRGTIDFGTLRSGETRSIGLTILSNDAYAVRFDSENHGAMVHDVFGAASSIAYKASFGDRPIDLQTGTATLTGYRATQRGGAARPLTVRIGDVGAARAGRYADRIVVTVLPDA